MSTANVSATPPNYAIGSRELSMTPSGGLRIASDVSSSLATITPSDSATFNPPIRQIYVGTTGNIALIGQDNTAPVILIGVPAGTILNIVASQIMATNTTASNLVGMY